ncbi:hypothetical protein MMC30_000216 [Trapelia coarctata]|nr:hypothetical protein [Trapelia coarctata]
MSTPPPPSTTTLTHALLPHPPYADDQPLARTILTTHVLHRGFQAGSLLGALVGSSRFLYRKLRPSPDPPLPNLSSWRFAQTPHGPSSPGRAGPYDSPLALRALRLRAFSASPVVGVLRATGTGAVVGALAAGVALVGRMRGREDIEWRDRAWRLLENEGQMGVDVGSAVGMVVGAVGVGVMVLRGRGGGAVKGMRGMTGTRVGWRGVVGGVGLGGLGGVGGWMGYRGLRGRGDGE